MEDNSFYLSGEFIGMAVIWQSLGNIADALRAHARHGFVNEENPQKNYQIEDDSLDLSKVRFGCPLYNPCPQGVVVFRPSCSVSWCIWVSNLQDGWDSFLTVLSKKHHWTALKIRSSHPDTAPNWIQEMTVIDGVSITRLVRTMWDGHADFYEQGVPLFCEETERYKAKLIKSRLTRNALAGYLVKLGLPVYRPDFWTSSEPATYLWKTWPTKAGPAP